MKITADDINQMLAWAEEFPPAELFYELEIGETDGSEGQFISNAVRGDAVPFTLNNLRISGKVDTRGLPKIVEHYARKLSVSRDEIRGGRGVQEDLIDYSLRMSIVMVIADLLGRQPDYKAAFEDYPFSGISKELVLKCDLRFENGKPFTAGEVREILAGTPRLGLSDKDRAKIFGA